MPDFDLELTIERAEGARGAFNATPARATVNLEIRLEGDSSELHALAASAGDEAQRLLGAAAVALRTANAETLTVHETSREPDDEEEEVDDDPFKGGANRESVHVEPRAGDPPVPVPGDHLSDPKGEASP